MATDEARIADHLLHRTIFSNPDMRKSQKEAVLPKAFPGVFVRGVILLTGFVLNSLSGFGSAVVV